MSVYGKVQHVMIPLKDIEAGQKKWIGEIADLVQAFAEDMELGDGPELSMSSFVLQTAGEALWRDCEGNPCWSQLDVESYLRPFDQAPEHEEHRACAVMVLAAFYDWLASTSRLRGQQAREILKKLEPRLTECMLETPA